MEHEPWWKSMDKHDAACALYWYLEWTHSGQTSAEYAAIQRLGYKPGMLERIPTKDAKPMFNALCSLDEGDHPLMAVDWREVFKHVTGEEAP